MRIETIRNGRMSYSAPRKLNSLPLAAKSNIGHDTVAFKQGNTVKGAGLGAAFGLLAIGALSAVSGGLASPLLYGLYAAAFGTAGGIAGKALDEKEDKKLSLVA